MRCRKQNTPTTDSVGEVGSVSVGVGVACALLYYSVYKGNARAGDEEGGGGSDSRSKLISFSFSFMCVLSIRWISPCCGYEKLQRKHGQVQQVKPGTAGFSTPPSPPNATH